MTQNETWKNYLLALYRAEAVVTDDLFAPLHFNEATTLGDYRIDLLDVELPAIAYLMEIRQKALEDNAIFVALQGTMLELECMFGEKDGHATHRYLQIKHDGLPIDTDDLNPGEQEMLDDYLRVQRASFQRQARWFKSPRVSMPFPVTLQGNDMDIAEVLALHLHTSMTTFPDDKYLMKEFLSYFCHAWNLPATKDYYTLISHALARPHPTAFLEKMLGELQDYIDELDCKKK